MAEKKRHWFKWYPADWRGEPSLRMCSRAARSVWVDMLGLMHDSTLIGYLLLNGKKPSPEQLARVLGDDIRDLVPWLEELAAAGVWSETEDGVIFSRRMVRDNERAEKGRADVSLRWGAKAKQPQNADRSASRDPNRVPSSDPSTYILDARTRTKDLVGPGSEKAPEPTERASSPEGFEEFWKAYPRTPNMSKSEALKVWARLKRDGNLPPPDRMMVALAGYRKFLTDQSKGRPTPYPAAHAATWLNQQRFAGFLEAPAVGVTSTGAVISASWEAAHPETWGKLREQLREMHGSDSLWLQLFGRCQLQPGSPFTVICTDEFERDRLNDRFAAKLTAMFDVPVTFTVRRPFQSSPPSPTPTQELRH